MAVTETRRPVGGATLLLARHPAHPIREGVEGGLRPAPAGVMETSAGVTLDAWSIARTSQRITSYTRPIVGPELSRHGPLDVATVRDDIAAWNAYVRIKPGERASEEQRRKWVEALDGRPDFMRRLPEGQPGVSGRAPRHANR